MGIGQSTAIVSGRNGTFNAGNVYGEVVGQVRSVQVGHNWSIGNFRACCEKLKTGEPIVSPAFRSGADSRHKWQLVLYPNGDSLQNDNYVSLYLQLESTDGDATELSVKSAFTLAIINNKKEVVNKFHDQKEYYFVKGRTLWGYGRFINRAQLFEESMDGRCMLNPRAKYGRLTVLCLKEEGTGSSAIPAELNLLRISVADSLRRAAADMEELLRSGRMSDAAVAGSDGEPVPVHRAILAARSPFFAAMFEHDMLERKQDCVYLPDLRRPILMELLRFIYGGRVHNLEESVFELIVAADKYTMDDLRVVCEDYLMQGMANDNVVELLILSDMVNAKRLKSRTHAFIVENSKIIVELQSFKNAMDKYPKLIAEVFENMVKQE